MKAFDPTEFVAAGSAHHGAGIALSNSAVLPDPESAALELGRMAEGERPTTNAVYGRLHNETVSDFERALARVEGTDDAVAYASGMAAVTAVMLAVGQFGDEVLAIRPLYGGTDHLLSSGLLGLKVRYCTAEEAGDLVGPDTALVVAETPANPTLELLDIQALRRATGDVPLMIDNTFATPVLQNPAALGATFVLHSATKYIGGHGDVMGGVVAANEKWAARLRQVRIATGGILHPMAGYLLRRGLSTLAARMLLAQENARVLARELQGHLAVERVYFPELAGCDPRGLLGTQMRGPGAMLALDVAAGVDPVKVMQGVKVMLPAVSLGTTETLIQHPASLTHQVVAEEDRRRSGVSASLLRISVGLESPQALLADLVGAMEG